MPVRQSMFCEGRQEDPDANLQLYSWPELSGNALYIPDTRDFCLFLRIISGSYGFEIWVDSGSPGHRLVGRRLVEDLKEFV